MWFRQDLRLSDNPALAAAIRIGRVVPVFILDDATPGEWKLGGAARWWLHKSLSSLADSLSTRGSKLVLRRGDPRTVIQSLLRETGARHIFWNRQYEPWAIARDTALKSTFKAEGITSETFNASLLVEPWELKTGSGGPYKVFTPFWKAALQAVGDHGTIHAAAKIKSPENCPMSDTLSEWELEPSKPNWAAAFPELWTPGEPGAQARLQLFLSKSLPHYTDGRDRPDQPLTSRLSPHLHFGEISPRQVMQAVRAAAQVVNAEKSADKFLSEIGWREFSYHLLFHFPHLPTQNFREGFNSFPWMEDERSFKSWTRGQTGYPIVDAGMRELWTTGYMHNRVRMVAASFLVKHLLIRWQKGEAWFWDTLLDADLASNSASWQWVAGSGADAAPYFRIFNPILQGEKFDPDGTYVRRWIPELHRCEPLLIHQPWRSPNFASFRYPAPIVDHGYARTRALQAYKSTTYQEQL